MKFNCKEDIIQITPLWKGERMEDGRADVDRRVAANPRLGQAEVEVLREVAPALGADRDQPRGRRRRPRRCRRAP